MFTGVLCEREGLALKMSSLEGVDYICSYEYPFEVTGGGGKRWIQLLPHVFRMDTALSLDERADGVLVRSYDELMYVLSEGYRGEIVADSGLYTMNNAALQSLLEEGVTRAVCPPELNFRELLDRGGADRSELVLYGRSALMISANCTYKNSTSVTKYRHACLTECRPAALSSVADGRPSTPSSALHVDIHSAQSLSTFSDRSTSTKKCAGAGQERIQFYVNLTDRKRTDFPVLCDCRYCYNVIYNSVPTSLHKAMDKVLELSPASVRLDFTTEDLGSAMAVTKYYVNLIRNLESESRPGGKGTKTAVPKELEKFTYGHFKNGVE
ncbi:MAG: U32 family peptidase [Lachnospiraceae bacterium]|nr:U32 family peptidase [Lachnospiraceae bacterium]